MYDQEDILGTLNVYCSSTGDGVDTHKPAS